MGECRKKDPAAAWLHLLPGDPAGNKEPHGEGDPTEGPTGHGGFKKGNYMGKLWK